VALHGMPLTSARGIKPATVARERVGTLHQVIIRDARPDEYAAVGELRVAAYRELGLLPEGSGYAETLRRLGSGGDCVVLVAADEAGSSTLGTITLEPFGPANELARDETEADIRAFAVAPQTQGQGVGRKLLLAVIECAEKRGVRRLRLCTQPAMKAAQHLYTTTGFSRTPDLDFEPVPGITLRAYELALPLSPLLGRRLPDLSPSEPDQPNMLLCHARWVAAVRTDIALELGKPPAANGSSAE
jgi:ribosomal protein S18 acetylase RimI-like enzyme